MPSALPAPPESWESEDAALAAEHDLPWTTLADVLAQARALLDPVLADGGDAIWSRETWRWTADAPAERRSAARNQGS